MADSPTPPTPVAPRAPRSWVGWLSLRLAVVNILVLACSLLVWRPLRNQMEASYAEWDVNVPRTTSMVVAGQIDHTLYVGLAVMLLLGLKEFHRNKRQTLTINLVAFLAILAAWALLVVLLSRPMGVAS